MSDIKVISFDLDNTLWDINSVILRAERLQHDWLARHAPSFVENIAKQDLLKIRTQLLEKKPELRHNLSTLRQSVLQTALCQSGYNAAEARNLAEEGFQIFLHARHEVTYYDDALNVLELLAKSYVLGSLTNGNAEIHRLGLDRYFSFNFSAAHIGISKPAPDMFRAALNHNRVEPEEMIHVGDHLIDDIQGAAQLGIHTLWINHSGAPSEGDLRPSGEVHKLCDVPPSIEAIAAGNRGRSL